MSFALISIMESTKSDKGPKWEPPTLQAGIVIIKHAKLRHALNYQQ